MSDTPTKYIPGNLVMWFGLVAYIQAYEQRSRVPWYQVQFYKGSPLYWYPEEDLRPLTFREFLWYTDPVTGGLKIGKNKALPLLIANGMALLFIGCTFTIEGPWKFGPLIVGLGIIGVTIYGTWRNYTGKSA